MESKVKVLGHPIHPILIVFPMGLLATAVIFDILYLIRGTAEFALVSYWMIAAGVIGGLVAAAFGFLDWAAIPGGTRAKRIGLMHGAGNVVVVALFAVSWFMRLNDPSHLPPTLSIVLELMGAGIAGVTGWLGGELVDRLGVGVDEGANLNAPNSLSGRPAYDGVAQGERPHVPAPSTSR